MSQVVSSPLTGKTLSPMWQGHGLSNQPVYRPAHELRRLMAGGLGSGQSSFFNSIPNMLIMDYERGTEELPMVHESTHRVQVSTYEQADELLKLLEADAEKNGKSRQFKMVGIDTADSFGGSQNSVIAEYIVRDSKSDVIAQFGGNGAGWTRFNEIFGRYLLRIEQAGYGWVACCHLKRKQVVAGDTGVARTMIQ